MGNYGSNATYKPLVNLALFILLAFLAMGLLIGSGNLFEQAVHAITEADSHKRISDAQAETIVTKTRLEAERLRADHEAYLKDLARRDELAASLHQTLLAGINAVCDAIQQLVSGLTTAGFAALIILVIRGIWVLSARWSLVGSSGAPTPPATPANHDQISAPPILAVREDLSAPGNALRMPATPSHNGTSPITREQLRAMRVMAQRRELESRQQWSGVVVHSRPPS